MKRMQRRKKNGKEENGGRGTSKEGERSEIFKRKKTGTRVKGEKK